MIREPNVDNARLGDVRKNPRTYLGRARATATVLLAHDVKIVQEQALRRFLSLETAPPV